MAISQALQTRLQLRESTLGNEWQIWEHKTFNIHRGVLHWRPTIANLSYVDMVAQIREQVKANYSISWWRGFAFGVVIESPEIPADISMIEESIDTRASSKGTWQWTVFICEPTQTLIGIHTWTEGYLSPAYRDLLKHFESLSWTVGSFKKEKDKLMQFLTAISSLKRIKLQEFEK
jgi:hypothetical protein